MGKGHNGETCAEAMRTAIGLLGKRASAQDIFDEVKKRGDWVDDTILQHLMSCTVNLWPGYKRWKLRPDKKCLFLRENGDYELYDPEQHGRYVDGRRIG